MNLVAILIGAPGCASVTLDLVKRVRGQLPGPGETEWLSEAEACQIPLTQASSGLAALLRHARETVRDAPVDLAILPAENRRKKLLVADMDSTIIQQECIDEIADFAGIKHEIAAITESAMRGELEFEAALRKRVGLLKGLDEAVLERVATERLELMPGAQTLVRTMRASGAYCALVSGGFSYFTNRVAALAGFDTEQANRLGIVKGKLSGEVAEPILGKDAKLDALRAYRRKLSLGADDTLAVGDGANDLAMLTEAGLGVAYRAKPLVAAQADARIDHGDLTALLYLQGYPRASFVR